MGDGYRSVDPATSNAVGCWTCRVRRKKCDNEWPVCQVCSALLITCHYNLEKPDWVDGGQRQQEMAEKLKQEVRDKAPYRRSLAYAKVLSEPEPTPPPAPDRAPDSRDQPFADKGLHSVVDWAGVDRGFIACYLDFYFPFLFPFYRPSMLDRGRAWVLDFIADNQAMEQATLSLSSYFFSLTLETGKSGHEKCKQLAWNKLLDQIHSTFMLLQEELRCLTAKDPSEYLSRMAPTMGCILMLQRFETTVSSFENCQAHLSAAIELFEQVLAGTRRANDQNGRASKFAPILPPWPRHFQPFQALSSEQMAFQFFSALVLVDDIVASTALGEEPKLYQYHESILGNGQWLAESDDKTHLRLDYIFGCQNWVMVAIAKISALNAWKKQQKDAGDLDMIELVRRASLIKNMLATNLARAEASSPCTIGTRTNPWDIFTPWNNQASALATQSLLVTCIWANAASIYLSVVVSGWQPASSEIRHHVARILELLTQNELSPAVLRTVVWPFCVAGCLAGPEQEPLLRNIIEALRPPGIFGPLWKALEIMESVWRSRESLNSTSWDIEACFRGAEHLVLLV